MSSETTVVAIGDSAMWSTGTAYRYKPPNLVHKQLNDGDPIPPVQFRARGGGIIGHPVTNATQTDLQGHTKSVMDMLGKWTSSGQLPGTVNIKQTSRISPVNLKRVPVDNRIDPSDTSWDESGINAATTSKRSSTTGIGTTWDPADDDYRYYEYKPHTSRLRQQYDTAFDKLNDDALNGPQNPRDINDLKWSVRRDIGGSYPTHLEQIDQFAGQTKKRTKKRGKDEKVLTHRLDVPWFDWNGSTYEAPGSRRELEFFKDKDYPPLNPSSRGDGAEKPLIRTAGPNVDPSDPDALDPHPPAPEEVNVVMLNGATNDVGLFFMMNFLAHTYQTLLERIEEYCYRDTKVMLREARERFPNALLVLVGYPFFLSEWSNYVRGRQWLQGFKGSGLGTMVRTLGSIPTHHVMDRVVDGAMVFHRTHQHYLRKAAAERSHAEVRNGDPGVLYVSRGFGAINAYEGPDTWAWDGSNDDLAGRRKRLLALAGASDPLNESASIGHPNRKGSLETAKAVVNRYRDRTSLRVGETATKLAGGAGAGKPTSLKGALRTHDLFPNSFNTAGKGSVRHALTHRYVDSIQLRFYCGRTLNHATWWQKRTGGQEAHLPASADLFLDISPGRTGTGETYRVDYESDGAKNDTPQFDEHSDTADQGTPALRGFLATITVGTSKKLFNSLPDVVMDRDGDPGDKHVVTEVGFDPMAGRKFDEHVSTNYGPDRGQKEDNVRDRGKNRDIVWNSKGHGSHDDLPNSKADFADRNRTDDDRLMLHQLRNATLRVRNPGFWALRRVEFTVNGELTWSVSGLEKRIKQAAQSGAKEVTVDLFSA